MSVWHEVSSCLLQRQLISPAAIVERDLSIVDLTGDLDTFDARAGHGDGFVVKLGSSTQRNAAIARESDMYAALSAAARLRRYLPRSYGYDPTTRSLVIDSGKGWRTIRAQQYSTGRFSQGSAASVGRALATLHESAVVPSSLDTAPSIVPWALRLHLPTAVVLRSASHASQQWIASIQRFPDLGGELDALHREWTVNALIHGDVKWDNILTTSGRRAGLRLIDWELAQTGDAAWDVGSFFSEYLTCWLRSMPPLAALDTQLIASHAGIPLARLQPAMRSFWSAYARSRFAPDTVTTKATVDFLLRATRYCAARMLQSGYERLQVEERAGVLDTLLLQICLNILRQPVRAATQLLGISVNDAVTT